MTVVRKATTADAVRGDLEYVLSDATVDRYGDTIDASGWDLRSFSKNPIALFNHDSKFPIGKWANVRVEGDALKGRLELAAEGTSERIDEIRRLAEQGILRAVSVGFRAIDAEPRTGGKGLRYKKQELMETSLVSVPANPNAVQLAKSMNISDETISRVFGENAERDHRVNSRMTARLERASPGEHAAIPIHRKITAMNAPLSKRIEDAQNDLVREKDELTNHISADDADPIVTEELTNRIEQKEASLAALKRAESALAVKSLPSVGGGNVGAPAVGGRRPFGLPAKELRPAEFLIRSAVAHTISNVTGKDLDVVLNERYGGDEGTAVVAKAAVAGATTSTSGWAAELVVTAMGDFLDLLTPFAIYPTLAQIGGRMTFGPNQGAIKIPSRATTPSIAGSFVGEGAPIPVRRLGLTSITLTPRKMAVVSVFSREIAKYSTPAIEGLIRQAIVRDTGITLDSLLLDATASSSVRPAGLLNGVSALTATTGGGANAIIKDIAQLAAPFDAANAGRNLVILMHPKQARSLRMTPGPGTAGNLLNWTDTVLSEFRVITSTTVPADRVIMIDADDFVSATGDVPEFDMSEETVLHMEDTTPLQLSAAGSPNTVAAPVQSMFQTAQIAVRMQLDVSWAMRRSGMISYLDSATW